MTLTAHAAHSLLVALKRRGKSVLLDELSELGGDGEVLERLLVRMRRGADHACELGYSYAFLLSWLVARIGPNLGITCELLEAELAATAKSSVGLVMPRWTLAAPTVGALQRRIPCLPFVDPDDQDLALAYRGLVDHLAFISGLPDESRRLEMLNTAIPWRVVALADKLEPESPRADGRPDAIASRLQRLKARTVGGARTSTLERDLWRSLDGDLCLRRHALSHLAETNGGWTFSRVLDVMWSLDEARAATAGIGLAVLDSVNGYLRNMPPNSRWLDAVIDDAETSWLDDWEET
jgi:hypothetical protein